MEYLCMNIHFQRKHVNSAICAYLLAYMFYSVDGKYNILLALIILIKKCIFIPKKEAFKIG